MVVVPFRFTMFPSHSPKFLVFSYFDFQRPQGENDEREGEAISSLQVFSKGMSRKSYAGAESAFPIRSGGASSTPAPPTLIRCRHQSIPWCSSWSLAQWQHAPMQRGREEFAVAFFLRHSPTGLPHILMNVKWDRYSKTSSLPIKCVTIHSRISIFVLKKTMT